MQLTHVVWVQHSFGSQSHPYSLFHRKLESSSTELPNIYIHNFPPVAVRQARGHCGKGPKWVVIEVTDVGDGDWKKELGTLRATDVRAE